MAFWNSKPKVATMSVTDHVRIVSEKVGEARKDLLLEVEQANTRGDKWRDRVFTQAREMENLRAELATLKAEHDGLLNERDILSEACNEAATTRDKAAFELAFWKKHGQLRDPATGRLIPKAKPSDTFTASHSPKAQAARGGDVREGV